MLAGARRQARGHPGSRAAGRPRVVAGCGPAAVCDAEGAGLVTVGSESPRADRARARRDDRRATPVGSAVPGGAGAAGLRGPWTPSSASSRGTTAARSPGLRSQVAAELASLAGRPVADRRGGGAADRDLDRSRRRPGRGRRALGARAGRTSGRRRGRTGRRGRQPSSATSRGARRGPRSHRPRARSGDLLVIGSRRYGPARSVLVGSVGHHLAHSATCPVLIVPRGVETGRAGEVLAASTAGADHRPSRNGGYSSRMSATYAATRSDHRAMPTRRSNTSRG